MDSPLSSSSSSSSSSSTPPQPTRMRYSSFATQRPPPESPGGVEPPSSQEDDAVEVKRPIFSLSPLSSSQKKHKRSSPVSSASKRRKTNNGVSQPPSSLFRNLNINYQPSSPRITTGEMPVVGNSNKDGKEEKDGKGEENEEPVEEEIACPFDDDEYQGWTHPKYDEEKECYLCTVAEANPSASEEINEAILKKIFLQSYKDNGLPQASRDVQNYYQKEIQPIPQLRADGQTEKFLPHWSRPVIIAHFLKHNQDKEIVEEWMRRCTFQVMAKLYTSGMCQKNRFTNTKSVNHKNAELFLKYQKTYTSLSSSSSSSSSGGFRK